MDSRGVWTGIAATMLTVGGTVVLTAGAVESDGIEWDSAWIILAFAAIGLGLLLFTSLLWGVPFRALAPSEVPAIATAARLRGRELLEEFPESTFGGGADFFALKGQVLRWIAATYADLKIAKPSAAKRYGQAPSDVAYADMDKLREALIDKLRRLDGLR